MRPVLEVTDLRLGFERYRGLWRRTRHEALRGVSLFARAGEVTALIGASGAGKSLLAHAVLGILPGNARLEGTMRFCGTPLDPPTQRRLRGRAIALVPQTIGHLDPLAKCGRQLAWAARRGRVPARGLADHLERTITRHGLVREVLGTYPHQLSGGMARRVLIAIATVAEASLILADEPTRGLDAATARGVLARFRELADRGKSILLISHDLEAVLKVADTVVVMREGATVDALPAHDFAQGGPCPKAHAYACALWRALPRNGLVAPASD